MRILLVEDNANLATSISERLLRDGNAVDVENDGEVAEELLEFKKFELVLLDINLPNRSGFEIIKSMRNRGDNTPVIIITARSQIDDRLIGLDSGADDYLTKPFDTRELSARCRALLRRKSGYTSNIIEIGNLEFDRGSKQLSINRQQILIRNKEIQLLQIFLDNINRIISKDEIADKIYNFNESPSPNAIEQLTTRLRKKLAGSPLNITTIRGLGYLANTSD
jgi:two-component system response regulator TctD